MEERRCEWRFLSPHWLLVVVLSSQFHPGDSSSAGLAEAAPPRLDLQAKCSRGLRSHRHQQKPPTFPTSKSHLK